MAKITLWYPEERPAYTLYTPDGVEVGPTLSAEEVYCDMCNAHVPLNPAPMIGSYVLCLDCLEKVEPGWRKQVTPLLAMIWREQMASE